MKRSYLMLLCIGSFILISTQVIASPDKSTAKDVPSSNQCKEIAHRVYALSGWRDRPDTRPLAGCNVPTRTLKVKFYQYRTYRKVARFPSPLGRGKKSPSDLRFFAIPYYIVCGETEPHWRGKGAFRLQDGIYQIIPSTWAAYGGTKYASIAGAATPLQQHIIADKAYPQEAWYGSC